MKMLKTMPGLAALVLLSASASESDVLKAALTKKMLPGNADITSYTTVFNEIEAADAADSAPSNGLP